MGGRIVINCGQFIEKCVEQRQSTIITRKGIYIKSKTHFCERNLHLECEGAHAFIESDDVLNGKFICIGDKTELALKANHVIIPKQCIENARSILIPVHPESRKKRKKVHTIHCNKLSI